MPGGIARAPADHGAHAVQFYGDDGGLTAGRLFMIDAAEMPRGFLVGDQLDSAGFRAAADDRS